MVGGGGGRHPPLLRRADRADLRLPERLLAGGVLSVLAMAVGTAITVSVLATLAVTAKNWAVAVAGDGRMGNRVHATIEIAGAALVLLLGLLLLGASLSGVTMATSSPSPLTGRHALKRSLRGDTDGGNFAGCDLPLIRQHGDCRRRDGAEESYSPPLPSAPQPRYQKKRRDRTPRRTGPAASRRNSSESQP